MARSSAWALLALVAVVQLACWRGTQRLGALAGEGQALRRRELPQLLSRWPLDDEAGSSGLGNATLHRRSAAPPLAPLAHDAEQCFPLPVLAPAAELCAHVVAFCPPSGRLDYLRFYYCAGVAPAANETAEAGKHAQPLAHSEDRASLADGVERPAAPSQRITHSDDRPPTHSRHGSTAPRHGKPGPPLPAGVAAQRGLALAAIVLWMLFLFSWVGVVASDFFCPNLSTLASRLGLNESTAGVTFLAFGNGSPDVFSTFGAMKTGSGSLAIGELIGAASFIVSVISGSMMLIAPFHVKPYPFLRDVGFFTVAVSMTLAFLFDGHLRFAECLSLVALYVCYATTVIIGSWVQERQRRRRMAVAAARGEYLSAGSRAGTPYEDEPSLGDVERASTHGGLLAVPGGSNSPYLSPVSPNEYDPDVNPIDIWADQTGRPISTPPSPRGSPRLGAVSPATTPSGGRANLVRSQTRFRSGVVARHSLLGAVEFRDVVRSLQLESTADRSMEVFAARDPERFLPHPAHPHGRPRHVHKRGVSVGGGPMSALEPGAAAQNFPSLGRNRANSTGASSKPALARSHSAVPDLGGDDAASGGWSSLTVRQPARGRGAAPVPVDDPWREHAPGDACDDELLLPPSSMPLGSDAARAVPSLPRLDTRLAPPASVGDSSSRNHSPVPSIHISAANSDDEDFKARRRASIGTGAQTSRTERALELHREFTRPLRRALFPSLRHFKDKSWLGLFVSVVTAPALLLLNLTLPVVDDDAESRAIAMPEQPQSAGAVRLEGEERLLTAHAEVSSEEEEADGPIVQLGVSTPDSDPWAARDRQHNAQRDLGVAAALRHLPSSDSLSVRTMALDEPAASAQPQEQCDDCSSVDSHSAPATGAPLLQSVAQCAFSPPFVVWALTDPHERSSGWKVLVALLAGLCLGALVLAAGLRARSRGGAWYSPRATLAVGMARCSLGFLVSVMWIMTIVDEVVSILQTIGLICGLSDAILGLTVFAMGNSLGDLVANVTIAKMGHPVMAISACFAGPLLNLLLGIGISGTYLLSGPSKSHIPQVDGGVYHIDFSPTLLVSGLGLLLILLGTLVAVPMNGFLLSRGLGYTLIATYAAIMCTNILVEVFYMRQS